MKQRDKLPEPFRIEQELDELARLLGHRAEIIDGYKLALSLGTDPREGSEYGVSVMAGLSDYVPAAADPYRQDNGKLSRPAVYKGIARGIYSKVLAATQNLGNALGDCSGGLMGAGVRQVRASDKGVPNPELLRSSAEAKCKRDGHVWDDKVRQCKVCEEPLPEQEAG